MEYSEFMANSIVEPLGDSMWDVYVNGMFKITDCVGENESEAKEYAWSHIKRIKDKSDEEN